MNHKELLGRMRAKHILVVGDLMIDKYIWGKAEDISPEAPVPVVKVEKETFSLGGAALAAKYAKDLGMEVSICGVIGDDHHGEVFRQEADRCDIDTSLVQTQYGRPTTTKIRVIAGKSQMMRFDLEETGPIAQRVTETCLQKIAAQTWDAIIFSDYNKGMNSPLFVHALIRHARENNIPIIVDPKVADTALYQGAYLVTPNEKEARMLAGCDEDTAVDAIGVSLAQKLSSHVLITLAERGMEWFDRKTGERITSPTVASEVADVTGAGDSVIATIAGAVAAGAEPAEAMALANRVASICVRKIGTATVTPSEVLGGL